MAVAFSFSKQALAQATYLAPPLPGAAISLTVDASSTHVGVGLCQWWQGSVVWESLGFFSMKLGPAQTKYSAFDQEHLACASGIYHFQYMLEGWRFTIFTDNKPLTPSAGLLTLWMSRQSRHLSYMAEYTSYIRYISGLNNIVTDTLSRPPITVAAAFLCSCAFTSAGLGPSSVKEACGLLALKAGVSSSACSAASAVLPSPATSLIGAEWKSEHISGSVSVSLISAVTTAVEAFVDLQSLAADQMSCSATAPL
jgi:hypothetical protein